MALLVCERGGDFFFLDELQRGREGERESKTSFAHNELRETREMMTHSGKDHCAEP